MTQKIIFGSGLIFISFLFFGCHKKKPAEEYSYNPLGYYYKLISFESASSNSLHNKVAWVSASFKTQSDSVFWDSFNNLNDKFYLENDSTENHNFFRSYVSKCVEQDSVCLLIKTKDFYRQQFKISSVPFFSKTDSIVKINFKVKRVIEKEEFVRIQHNLLQKEKAQILKFFGTAAEMEAAEDPQGFYWVYRPDPSMGEAIKYGDIVSIAYKGEYLNGRFLEKSGASFEYIYGTPDQLLKGLNYVIGRLKNGENAKIILPSRLAFGEYGSSNGTVPPYTPLVYEVQIIDLKTNEQTP